MNNTNPLENTLDQAIRATDLRQLGVKYGERTVETVASLAYDHQAGQVTGVHLQSASGVQRQVAFESLDLSRMPQGELRLEPPVLSGNLSAPQPIDTLTVLLPSGQTAYVQDSFFHPHTGQILAYEISLEQPGRGGDKVRVMPDEVKLTLQGEPWQVNDSVEARLRSAQGFGA